MICDATITSSLAYTWILSHMLGNFPDSHLQQLINPEFAITQKQNTIYCTRSKIMHTRVSQGFNSFLLERKLLVNVDLYADTYHKAWPTSARAYFSCHPWGSNKFCKAEI